MDDRAIGQGDADRRQLYAGCRGVGQRGAKVEQLRPLSRVLSAGNLAIGGVGEGVSAISQKPAFGDLGSIEFFSHHGFDWIPPERND